MFVLEQMFWSKKARGLSDNLVFTPPHTLQLAGSVRLCTYLHNYVDILHGQALTSISGM